MVHDRIVMAVAFLVSWRYKTILPLVTARDDQRSVSTENCLAESFVAKSARRVQTSSDQSGWAAPSVAGSPRTTRQFPQRKALALAQRVAPRQRAETGVVAKA